MKKGILFAVCVVFLAVGAGYVLSGCATDGGAPVGTIFDDGNCTIYEDVGATPENSVIAKLIKNPCAAQTILATAAQLPFMWKQKNYYEMFDKWADKIQQYIESGMTYADLQQIVVISIANFNKDVGVGLLIVSDGILVFDNQKSIIGEKDRTLLLMSLTDLRAKVSRMATLTS